MQKDTKIALAFCGVFVGLLVFGAAFRGTSSVVSSDVVTFDAGTQVIDISVNGGYTPSRVTAQAHVPTEIRLHTNGTYDCSASFVIPSLGYKKMLPATGITMVALSEDQAEGTLQATCGMGMYHLAIAFK